MHYEEHRARAISGAISAPCSCIWCLRSERIVEKNNLRGISLVPAAERRARVMIVLEVWDE